MNSTNSIRSGSSSLLVLFLVFVFVMCALFLILYGANVYDSIRIRVDDDFVRRMSVSYITNKIRASDVRDGVTVGENNSTLILRSDPEDEFAQFIYIYYHNGSIMEYITQDLEEFDADEGEIIMEVDSFSVYTIMGGLTMVVSTNGEIISYSVSLRSA